MIGNYWSDYPGKDANDDGIGDTPYTIPGLEISQDNYPIWWDPPNISIFTPLVNGTFRKNAPEYNLSIEGVPQTMWYIIEDIIGNFSITELTGTIDQDAWNNLTEGSITMTFYAQDSEGEIGTKSIALIKNIPSKIPGYNLFFLLGVLSVAVLIITRKIKK
ncbi:MAG: Loki-CTERM sorting domain-containing protein [Candidatus Lokiarchaeia archaeon]